MLGCEECLDHLDCQESKESKGNQDVRESKLQQMNLKPTYLNIKFTKVMNYELFHESKAIQ